MFFLIPYLITLISSAPTCSGTTVTITDQQSITKSDLTSCPNADTIVVTSSGDVQFPLDSFMQVSTLKKIIVNASSVSFEQQSFQQASNVELIQIYAAKTISFKLDSFNHAHVANVQCYAGNEINFEQQSFQQVTEIELLNLTSGGTISLKLDSFIGSTVDEVILSSVQDINIEQQAMQQVKNFKKLTIKTEGNFNAKISSFISSMIQQLYVECNGTAIFNQQSFQGTPNLTNYTVIAYQGIRFEIDSFISSNVGEIYLYTHGPLYFGQQAFQNCHNLTNLTIHGTNDITFGLDAFINSQIQGLDITSSNETSSAKVLADSGSITFEQGSFQNCNELRTVDVQTNGNVNIKSNSFQNSKQLHTLNVNAKDGTATVESGAFQGCSALTNHNVAGGTVDIKGGAFENDNGGKKKHGSSHKDSDDDSESSAKTLGNIKIESVYLGTSPNIVFDLNLFVSIMQRARRLFGHVIPSPEFVHSAIWVGKEGATDNTLGAIFVYGKYWNKKNLPSYIEHDGAKAYVMTLGEFKQRYPSIDPIKLNPHKNINMFDFIRKVRQSGNWGASDYNWPTNNCQHFTAKLINILKATRDQPNNEDWVNLPKPVLNSLKVNEEFLKINTIGKCIFTYFG